HLHIEWVFLGWKGGEPDTYIKVNPLAAWKEMTHRLCCVREINAPPYFSMHLLLCGLRALLFLTHTRY
ncbi:hypothetical protein NDU88_010712, partial [Pleurodeles waltl]